MKTAIISGISGQDGSYLAELLIRKNYAVHGIIMPQAVEDPNRLWRLSGFIEKLQLHYFDVTDFEKLASLFLNCLPSEIYHLASRVEPRVIFEEERGIFEANFHGAYNFLYLMKKYKPSCRLYCAGSSLMFGAVDSSPQNEDTPMNPTTPYGIGKVAAHHFVRMYREAHGMFACTGILFNHESPRRDVNFLPRKISLAAANIKVGRQEKLLLGDIELKRDWAYAGDVVESMWLMLQQERPEDFVIGTSQLHSIRDVLDIAFGYLGLTWKDYVIQDPSLVRNIEYVNLCADISKAKSKLGWAPSVKLRELIENMVQNDFERVAKQ
ncbi:MAG: GDP-mannose 4,6-dehydratase [Polaromonas sp.]|nr:GDP-mannose 4,6-dehydratase [Polaromonas sp.]MDP3751407.1 GDP-mannose 4,6-dehydratase [Polaromonas sp.]